MENKNCSLCSLSDEDKKWQLYENGYWIVFMADKQDYTGRCFVMSKRHIESINGINTDEWISLKDIICGLEKLLKNEFGAELINLSCLMNDSYKETEPRPHMHFHIRPRYKSALYMFGQEFTDGSFGHHYDNNKNDIPDEIKQKIFCYMKERINKYFQ